MARAGLQDNYFTDKNAINRGNKQGLIKQLLIKDFWF